MGLKQWLGSALLLLLWSAVTLFAQDAGELKLSGRITDSSGAGLASSELEIVNVNTKEKLMVTSTDDGRYQAPITGAGYYAITVKKAGFAEQTTDPVEVRRGTATLNITMLPSAVSTTITVTSSEAVLLDASREVSTISLAPAQLTPIPSLGEQDIFRAFQLLPGVRSSETSAGLAVRGGRADQTFVNYDGFRAYGVDHLFGYFSAFNADALQRMELSKGGFEAKKGGVLSGFVDLTGKTGRLDRPEFTLGVSLLSVHGQFQTPIVSDKMSIIASYRKSFQSPLFNKILNTTQVGTAAPRGGPAPPAGGSGPPGFPGRPGAFFDSQPKSGFYDGNGKYLWKPSSQQTVAVSYYTGEDEIDNSRTLQLPTQFLETLQSRGVNLAERGIDISNPNLNITDLRATRNTGIGMEWNARINSRIGTSVSIGESRFQDVRNRSFRAGNNTNPAAEDNRMRDLNLRASVSVAAGDRNTFETGIDSTVIRYQYGFQSAAPPRTSSSGETTAPLAQVLNEAGRAHTNALFVQDRFVLGSRILLNPGVRLTTYDQTHDTYAEPRFAAYFHPNDELQFKAAIGQYHQFTSKVTREDLLQGNRAFWTAADGSSIPVSSSKELIVGASYQRGQWIADVEAYAKNLSGLSLFAPRFSAATESIDYRTFFYTGTGQARGIDVLLQKQSGRNTGWVSYTLSKVTESFPTLAAGVFPADQDQRHELKIVDIHPLRGWKVSGTWILSSGHPYTAPSGTETITLPFDQSRTFERVVAGPKNGERLPAYHRMDFSLTREIVPLGDGGKGVFAISIFNVYNRKNVWYKEFNAVAGSLTENNIRLMGTTLNISFTVSSGTKSW